MKFMPFAVVIAICLWSGAAAATDHPGQKFDIPPKDLARPYATPAVANSAIRVPRPGNAVPEVPPGFKVSLFASGLADPRWLAVAPNGDVFPAQPNRGTVSLLREGKNGVQVTSFATGFDRPHGLAIANGALYVGDMQAVWRLDLAGADKAAKR